MLKHFMFHISEELGGPAACVEQYKKDIIMQCEVRVLAHQFNELKPPKQIDVVEPYLVTLDAPMSESSDETVFFAEAFIKGDCERPAMPMSASILLLRNHIRLMGGHG